MQRNPVLVRVYQFERKFQENIREIAFEGKKNDNGYRYYGGYGLYDYPDYGYRDYGYPYHHGHEWREHHRH